MRASLARLVSAATPPQKMSFTRSLGQLTQLQLPQNMTELRATSLLLDDPYDSEFVSAEGNLEIVKQIERRAAIMIHNDTLPSEERVTHALHIAGVYIKNYQLDNAESALNAVEEWCKKVEGPFLWHWYQKRATLSFKQNRQGECAQILETLLKICPDNAATHSNLVTAYNCTGNFSAAEEHLKKCIELRYREAHPNEAVPSNLAPTVKEDVWSMGLILKNLGKLDKAEKHLLSALQLYTKSCADQVMIAKLHDSVADLYYVMGQWDNALTYFQKAHTLFERTVGATSPLTGRAAGLLGDCLAKLGGVGAGSALRYYIKALCVEVERDAIHPTPLYELFSKIITIFADHRQKDLLSENLSDIVPFVHTALKNLERKGLLEDGNGGVLLHKMGEVLLFSGSVEDSAEAATLFRRAKMLLEEETSVDMSSLLSILEMELQTAIDHVARGTPLVQALEESIKKVDSGGDDDADDNGYSPDNTMQEENAVLRSENAKLRLENARLLDILTKVKVGVSALDEL